MVTGTQVDATAKLNRIADSTVGTKHKQRNAVCPALPAPRVGRLRLMKDRPRTRHAHPPAKKGMSEMPHWYGLSSENQTMATAKSFSNSTTRHRTGRMTSQLSKRLRSTSATAAHESADMMPSLGVR